MEERPIAVIPARGGSRRIPDKNVKLFGGEPLIVYTIRAALTAELFARVVVSTDSKNIASIASAAGADVPFLRSATLADDYTPVSQVTTDAIQQLGYSSHPNTPVCQLMPNCPLRDHCDIRNSYAQFLRTRTSSQLSVVRFAWQNPWWAMTMGERFRLEPVFPEALSERSQDLPTLLTPTGAVWWARAGALTSSGTYYMPGASGWEISWSHGIDIDSPEEWSVAEALLPILREE